MNATAADVAATRRALALVRRLETTLGMAHLRPARRRFVEAPFHRSLAGVCDDVLAACLAQASPRVALSAPPRHGKSELVGRTLPAVAMLREPGFSVLYATSTHPRAEEVSVSVRSTIEWLYKTFAIPHLAPGEKWTTTEWITVGGNGWVGVGVGGATGGIGARLILADDTTGSEANARSPAFRRTWRRWMEGDVLSRLMSGGGLVNMETRRGVEDGYAYLTQEYGEVFRQYNWPLISTGPTAHDPRPEGAYLWPADKGWHPDPEQRAPGSDIRYGAEWHAANPQVSGRLLAQLYQGHPVPEAGGLLQRAWFGRSYPEHPKIKARNCRRVIAAVDCAQEQGEHNDWTVCQVWGQTATSLALLHEYRGRMDITQQAALMRRVRTEWPEVGRIYVENASNGASLLQAKPVYGMIAVKPHGRSKGERADHFAIAAEAAEVELPSVEHAPWIRDTVEEWVGFGVGAPHDDRTDAAAMAAEALTQASRKIGALNTRGGIV